MLATLDIKSLGKIVDIGGGWGNFAKACSNRSLNMVVLDSDIQAINFCKEKGISAIHGDALTPPIIGDEDIVCFNLILHHLVGSSEYETYEIQKQALSAWHSTVHAVFISEYIYESFLINDFSGRLIYYITSNTVLSNLCKFVTKFIPSLKANTFGVGVRFRSHNEWRKMFESMGFEIVDTKIGKQHGISLPRRLMLIKGCRVDNFLLKPIITEIQDIP
jgi:hypothetical protein